MEYKQVIIIRTDLNMSKGKSVAQGCHASLDAAMKVIAKDKVFKTSEFKTWSTNGAKKVVLRANSEAQLIKLRELAARANLPHALIRDAGFTEVPKGTKTALGIGPAEENKIDAITGDLQAL